MKRLSSFIIILGCTGMTSAAAGAERLELVWADSIVVEKLENETVQRLYDNVRMVQGEAFMHCDRAVNWEDRNRARLTGHVVLYDGRHSLEADEVDYDGDRRIETATGNVRVRTGERVLRADWLEYEQETARVRARGNIRLEDLVEGTVLTGRAAGYDRKADYGFVEGDAVLIRADTTAQDTLRISGRKMEAWGGSQQVSVTDSVRILKGGVEGASLFAEYWPDSSRIILSGLPRLHQRGEEMTGDTIVIRLEGAKFAGGMICGRAQIISRDSTAGNTEENTLQGRRIFIEASADTLRRVIVEGEAYSRFRVSEAEDREDRDNPEGINTITGDRLVMTFADNRVTWIRVESSPGLSEGTYTPLDPDKENTDSQ